MFKIYSTKAPHIYCLFIYKEDFIKLPVSVLKHLRKGAGNKQQVNMRKRCVLNSDLNIVTKLASLTAGYRFSKLFHNVGIATEYDCVPIKVFSRYCQYTGVYGINNDDRYS